MSWLFASGGQSIGASASASVLRVHWTAKRSNQSILKEINPEFSIGRTDAETPILWTPDARSRLTGKDADAGKDGGPEEEEGDRG